MPFRPLPAELSTYKPPSVLARYKGLAAVFAAVFLGLAVYCFKAPHGSRYAAPPKQPIYVDAVPQ